VLFGRCAVLEGAGQSIDRMYVYARMLGIQCTFPPQFLLWLGAI
jgi:hypothetical protein